MFERDGFFTARVDDIVVEAGVARGSFYTYFTSKADVFREIAADVERGIRQALRLADSGDQFQALHDSNLRYLTVYRANGAMCALIEQVASIDEEIHELRLGSRREHIDRVARSIGRWQEDGTADPTVDSTRTAAALVSMRSNFAYWWIAGVVDDDVAAAAATLTDIWARAIGMRRPADAPRGASPT